MLSRSQGGSCPTAGTTQSMANPRNSRPEAGTDATQSLERITEAAEDAGLSRRKVLSTAAAGAGAMAFAGNVGAQENGDGGSGGSDGGSSGSDGESEGPSHVEVLNYALTLEHLENEFYKQGLSDYDNNELMMAETLCQRNEGLNEEVPARIESIGAHEQAHVDQLTTVIEKLGGEPVEAACYEFGYESPSEFLQIAQVLENTGVSAYDGAIQFLEDDTLATAGATIATVEARHASYLNTLNQDSPFPDSFDQAKSMEEVRKAASQFIVECEDN